MDRATNNILVQDNILAGGGYTIYVLDRHNSGTTTNVSLVNNHIGAGYYGESSINVPVTKTGNVSDAASLIALLDKDGPYNPATPAGPTEGADTLTGDGNANTINALGGDDKVDGGAGNDTLNGGAGNDTLIGGAGKDTLTGGAGNDVFVFQAVSDSGTSATTRDVITDFTSGQDKIDLSAIDANTALSGNNDFVLVAANGGAFTGTAGQLIWASDSTNNRTLIQGDVNGDKVADFTIELTGVKSLTASDFLGVTAASPPPPPPATSPPPPPPVTVPAGPTEGADNLTGDANANTINGLGGNDTLNGGAGNDTLIGGAGKDTLTGGAGNDVFVFQAVSDSGTSATTRDVITDFTSGQDKIDLSAIDANTGVSGNSDFVLVAANGGAFTGTAGQLIWASDSTNGRTRIYGDVNGDKVADFSIELTGVKSLTAGDFLGVTTASPPPPPPPTSTTGKTMTGTASSDSLTGGDGNDTLLGNGGNDRLVGGNGDDIINGGTGRDFMTGGAGKDTFVFTASNETGGTATTRDVITDFTHGVDKIDLSAIDANTALAGNQAFTFMPIDDDFFHKKAGELAWRIESDKTVIQGDLNGDGVHDFEIQLTGQVQLTASDFIL